MIYTKITNREADFETIVSLEEGIFTDCNTCEREIQLEGEVMKHILEEGDLGSTKIICKDCTAEKFKKEAKKGRSLTMNLQVEGRLEHLEKRVAELEELVQEQPHNLILNPELINPQEIARYVKQSLLKENGCKVLKFEDLQTWMQERIREKQLEHPQRY